MQHRSSHLILHTSAFSPLTGSSPGGCRIEIQSRPSGYTIPIFFESIIDPLDDDDDAIYRLDDKTRD